MRSHHKPAGWLTYREESDFPISPVTTDEMYGYDDPEDNAEAVLDDVVKIQENS